MKIDGMEEKCHADDVRVKEKVRMRLTATYKDPVKEAARIRGIEQALMVVRKKYTEVFDGYMNKTVSREEWLEQEKELTKQGNKLRHDLNDEVVIRKKHKKKRRCKKRGRKKSKVKK